MASEKVKTRHIPFTKRAHCHFGLPQHDIQGRSQNAEIVTHIKGRLLDQAVILFKCVPLQNGTSLKGTNFLPEGANSFL